MTGADIRESSRKLHRQHHMTELLRRFEDHMTLDLGYAEQTVSTYSGEVRQFLRYLSSLDDQVGEGLAQVSASRVVDYLLERKLEGLDERTIAKALSAVRALFRFLQEHGEVNTDPTELVEAPKIARRIPRVFSLEEVERLLAAIDATTALGLRDRALFELIYSCGLRVSEAVGLTLDQVYFREAALRVRGKGSKDRWVPIGETAALWLKHYLEEGRPRLVRGPSSQLFLNSRGGGLSRKGMWKRFKDITQKARVEGKIHTLRHSYATHLLLGGADLRSVQELLGHADIVTTQIYTHVGRDELQKRHRAYHPRGSLADAGDGSRPLRGVKP